MCGFNETVELFTFNAKIYDQPNKQANMYKQQQQN